MDFLKIKEKCSCEISEWQVYVLQNRMRWRQSCPSGSRYGTSEGRERTDQRGDGKIDGDTWRVSSARVKNVVSPALYPDESSLHRPLKK